MRSSEETKLNRHTEMEFQSTPFLPCLGQHGMQDKGMKTSSHSFTFSKISIFIINIFVLYVIGFNQVMDNDLKEII